MDAELLYRLATQLAAETRRRCVLVDEDHTDGLGCDAPALRSRLGDVRRTPPRGS